MAPRLKLGAAIFYTRRRNVMEWLKSLWASWKVRVALVGGALVVATTYGTCTLDPNTVSDAGTTIETTTETVEVSTTPTDGAETETTTVTETTTTTGETTTTTE